MSFHVSAAQMLYLGARRLVHPVIDSFLPVTYTADKVRARKRRLDPTGARSERSIGPESITRILGLADVLHCDQDRLRSFITDAGRVSHMPVPKSDLPDLTSPMCWEDRYTLYVATRAVAPRVAVETGIAHGISSAFILGAMEDAGRGTLTSVEIVDDDARIGQAVPHQWRSRWRVLFGDSLTVLPAVLANCAGLDMFVHDSRHDYPYAWREFELAWAHLSPGGLLCAHDILENNAFPRFVHKYKREIAAWGSGINLGLIRKR